MRDTIPASSSPWYDSSVTTNKVHYAGVEDNGANYTWYTATAGTQGSSYSICPRGWKLPTKGEYDSLLSKAKITDNSAGSTKIRGVPYNFLYAGIVFGPLQNVGTSGFYWSSTASGSSSAYNLYFSSSNVGITNDGNVRYSGLSIRCIAP